MSKPIIEVRGLSKRYHLGTIGATSLRDEAERLLGMFRKPSARPSNEFWALKEVSFDVHPGEILGILGRNGAGKSTLLKILSRITEPTSGEAILRGRTSSLLEVGTGFHPELSGRENIYLNGAILGMRHREITAHFDEIVAFAELEKFIDTPVKRYSSGMYVRLAFAVAAHLEPEILIVDEVLAVGDVRFQEKCLGKIQSVTSEKGRTVLIVTHNPAIVLGLCKRAFYLSEGRLAKDGAPREVINEYVNSGRAHQFERALPAEKRCAIIQASANVEKSTKGDRLFIEAGISSRSAIRCAFEATIHDSVGQPIAFSSLGGMNPKQQVDLPPGESAIKCAVDISNLASGRYGISLKLVIPSMENLDEVPHCLSFEHEGTPGDGANYVLQQAWGAGYFTLPARRED